MKAPLFDDIIHISQKIADASANNDEATRELNYKELIKLCANNDNSPKDHPLQWEALADFTLDSDQAIDIYQKGVECAQRLSLANSAASIYLAMAMRFQEMEENDKMNTYVKLLNEMLAQVTNDELKSDVNEFFESIK